MIKFQKTALTKSFQLLNRRDRKKLSSIIVAQIILSIFDLVGISLIGVLGGISIQGLQKQEPSTSSNFLLNFFKISNYSFKAQAVILGASAVSILLLKTVISVYLTRKIFFYLSQKSATISAELILKILSQNLVDLRKKSSQDLIYNVTDGVKNITMGIIATRLTIISDFSLILIMLAGFYFYDPVIAVGSIILFIAAGIAIQVLLHKRSLDIGIQLNRLSVKSNLKLYEALNSFREFVVRNRNTYYAEEIRKIRLQLAKVQAELAFQPFITKYIIETITLLSAICLAIYEFQTKSPVEAVTLLAVFSAATSRMAPAALRIQQGLLTAKASFGSAQNTFELIGELQNVQVPETSTEIVSFDFQGFNPTITLENVSYKYPGSSNFEINNLSLLIPPGSTLAIVGSSGSGKTTLVDIILGILNPDSGSVTISGMSPSEASAKWSGAISYVPQDIFISSGTLKHNVGLGYPRELATVKQVEEALRIAQLEKFSQQLPFGIDSEIGEAGAMISGGQRQRVGIARGLFTGPRLLVLDEATSSLDASTEAKISEGIMNLAGHVTLIIVAHRLSTIRAADKIIYLENGKIVAAGTFEEIKEASPAFNRQAKLMGL